ncbi:hypothetical protein BH11PSE3_BH11PSE3_05510 [soil metagenome]
MAIVLVIRHAEKPDGINLGVDETGAADEQSLTVRGWQRAGAIGALFGSPPALPTPDRIYASAHGKRRTPDGKLGSRSRRPLATVSVLAAVLGLPIDETFAKGEESALIGHIAGLEGTTLVCWQHEPILAMAAALLGGARGVPSNWPSDRFDVMWRFTRDAAGQPWRFDQLCQRLLPGDGSKPIT